jgi:hypothetical protein
MRLLTVTVDRNGPVVINKSDFRPGVDRIYGATPDLSGKVAEVTTAQVDEADRLIAILAERGIKKDRRSSLETLRKLAES